MFDDFTLLRRGKVRDVYQHSDPKYLVLHATDRISVYDVVLPTIIPGKGEILTDISVFFMNMLEGGGTKTHLVDYYMGRRDAIVVKKAKQRPFEYIVRGFLYGSAWEKYRKGELQLPAGSNPVLAGALSEPFFTPTTKAQVGHDEYVDPSTIPVQEKDLSLRLYKRGREYLDERGVLLADTKFEFGDVDDQLMVTDEIFTPDSSRFWKKEDYLPGQEQKSFDKQVVRDYASGQGWNKTEPGPPLPEEIIRLTQERYEEIRQRIKSQK